MKDYDGDMNYFQKQLKQNGISKEELNMDNYVGLTPRELQGIVNLAIEKKVGGKSWQNKEF